MRKWLQVLSWSALAFVILPPVLYLAGQVEKDSMKVWMTVGTVLWFATVPWWMGRGRN
jgi:hypothetical protein